MPYEKSGSWRYFGKLPASDSEVWNSISSSSYAIPNNFELEAVNYTKQNGQIDQFYCVPCYMISSSAPPLNGSKGKRLACYNTAPSSVYDRGNPGSTNLRPCYPKQSLMIPLALEIIAMASSGKHESWMWTPDGGFDVTLEMNSLSATESPQYYFEPLDAVDSYWKAAAFYCADKVGDPAALTHCWDELPPSKLKRDTLWLHIPSSASRTLTQGCMHSVAGQGCPMTSQNSGFDRERVAEWLSHQGYIDENLWITHLPTQVTFENGQVLFRVTLWYRVFLWVMVCMILFGQLLEAFIVTCSRASVGEGAEPKHKKMERTSTKLSPESPSSMWQMLRLFIRTSASMRYPYESITLCESKKDRRKTQAREMLGKAEETSAEKLQKMADDMDSGDEESKDLKSALLPWVKYQNEKAKYKAELAEYNAAQATFNRNTASAEGVSATPKTDDVFADDALGVAVQPLSKESCPCHVVVVGMNTRDQAMIGVRCILLSLLFAASLGLPTAVAHFEWIILDLWYNDAPWNTLLIVLLGYLIIFTPLNELQQVARPLIELLRPRAIGMFAGSKIQLHGYNLWLLVWAAFWILFISINYSRLSKEQFDLVQDCLVFTALFGFVLLVCTIIFSSVRLRRLIGFDSSEHDEDGPFVEPDDYIEYQAMNWRQALTAPIGMGFGKIEVRSWMKYLDIKSGKGLSLVELYDSAESVEQRPGIKFMQASLPNGHGAVTGNDENDLLGVGMFRQIGDHKDYQIMKTLDQDADCEFEIDLNPDGDDSLFNALSMTGL